LPAYLEIDKLADGRYRATVGTLFEHQEITRTRGLETVRQANLIASGTPLERAVAFRDGLMIACRGL
jgi:hypothetical protein